MIPIHSFILILILLLFGEFKVSTMEIPDMSTSRDCTLGYSVNRRNFQITFFIVWKGHSDPLNIELLQHSTPVYQLSSAFGH